jgi:histidine ammonia-lyase
VTPRILRPGALDLDDLLSAHRGDAGFAIDASARVAVEQSAAIVKACAQGTAAVYGVNTGFGRLASKRIDSDDLATLQRNLIRSHCVGVGQPLGEGVVRLILVTKATSLARGHSGVRMRVIEALMDAVNAGVVPCIPSQGSVGASGDLAPLAHLTLALMGEGECLVQGTPHPAAGVLRAAGLQPLARRCPPRWLCMRSLRLSPCWKPRS